MSPFQKRVALIVGVSAISYVDPMLIFPAAVGYLMAFGLHPSSQERR